MRSVSCLVACLALGVLAHAQTDPTSAPPLEAKKARLAEVIRIQAATAEDVQEAVKKAAKAAGRANVEILADARTNSLLVSAATEDDVEWVRAIVTSLDEPPSRPLEKRRVTPVPIPERTVARFSVTHLDLGIAARRVRTGLESLTREQVTIVADDATRSLHVMASSRDHARVEGMLAVMDQPAAPPAPLAAPVVSLIRVRGPSVEVAAKALTVCAAARGDAATITPIEGTDRVVIAGPAASVAALTDIAERLSR